MTNAGGHEPRKSIAPPNAFDVFLEVIGCIQTYAGMLDTILSKPDDDPAPDAFLRIADAVVSSCLAAEAVLNGLERDHPVRLVAMCAQLDYRAARLGVEGVFLLALLRFPGPAFERQLMEVRRRLVPVATDAPGVGGSASR